MTSDTHQLTAAELAQYERDGYLIRHHVFDADEVAAIAEECERLVDRVVEGHTQQRRQFGSYVFDANDQQAVVIKWEGDTDVVHGLEPFAHVAPVLEEWAYDGRLVAPARALLGHDEIELFTEKLNLKRPHQGGENPLHQDYPYWVGAADRAEEILTTIIFLDDATVENGCLWVVPGSHSHGEWKTRTDGAPGTDREIDVAAYPDLEEVPVELAAGSTLSFGPMLVHRSAPNRSSNSRRALLYSYQPAGRRRQVDNVRTWSSRTSA